MEDDDLRSFRLTTRGRATWRWRFRHAPQKHQSMMKNHHRMASEVVTPRRGIIINRHAEEGQLDDTSIIFTTDNGNFHAKHGKK